jgi:hypothetical protein
LLRGRETLPGNSEREAERRMTDQDVAGIAFARAWSVYLMINKEIDANDERRATLERFIVKRCQAGENDPQALTVEGLAYLKKLDG